jgi:hypothetical protein
MSKESYYFSHDYNTRTDDKVKKLIRKYGMNGYGIFWAIVEDLYNNANALQMDCEGIAFELRTDSDTIESIINDFDLFVVKDGIFGSRSVERRLDERNKKSETARQSAFKRWGEKKEDATALPLEYSGNAIKERKEKEIKENKIDFSEFWNLYGKKDGDKNGCIKKWDKLTLEEQTKIISILPTYLKTIKEKQFQPYPSTWLNQRRWENEDLIQQERKTTVSRITLNPDTDLIPSPAWEEPRRLSNANR